MASNYPTNLDALTNPAPGSTMLSPAHSAQHANANDAIEAVQATLGTNPQGGSATVKARIAAAETALTAKASTAYVDALNTAMDTRVDAIESTTSFSSLQSAWQADDAEVRAVADAALVAASSGGAGDSYSINVKSFGALGNGTTNDTTAIQAALGSSVQLRSGLVWAVMVLQGGTGVAVRAQKHPLAIPAGDETVTLSGATTMWVDSTTISGALPGTFTVPSGPSGAVAPALALRRSTT